MIQPPTVFNYGPLLLNVSLKSRVNRNKSHISYATVHSL